MSKHIRVVVSTRYNSYTIDYICSLPRLRFVSWDIHCVSTSGNGSKRDGMRSDWGIRQPHSVAHAFVPTLNVILIWRWAYHHSSTVCGVLERQSKGFRKQTVRSVSADYGIDRGASAEGVV